MSSSGNRPVSQSASQSRFVEVRSSAPVRELQSPRPSEGVHEAKGDKLNKV